MFDVEKIQCCEMKFDAESHSVLREFRIFEILVDNEKTLCCRLILMLRDIECSKSFMP